MLSHTQDNMWMHTVDLNTGMANVIVIVWEDPLSLSHSAHGQMCSQVSQNSSFHHDGKLSWSRWNKTGPNHDSTTTMLHRYWNVISFFSIHYLQQILIFWSYLPTQYFLIIPSGFSTWSLVTCRWSAVSFSVPLKSFLMCHDTHVDMLWRSDFDRWLLFKWNIALTDTWSSSSHW